MSEKEPLRGRRTAVDKKRVELSMIANFNSLVGDLLDPDFVFDQVRQNQYLPLPAISQVSSRGGDSIRSL